MEAQTQHDQAEVAASSKTIIRPNVGNMVKTATGSFHKDDLIGNALNGLNIDQVKAIAADLGLDANKYDHLNVGQQRMNLGNGLRRLSAKPEALDRIVEMAGPMREANEEARVAAATAKVEAKVAKMAEVKEAKPKKAKKIKAEDQGELPV